MAISRKPKHRRCYYLSRKQSDTLEGIVQILSNRKPKESVISSLESSKLILKKNDDYFVTREGLYETDRLLKVTGILENNLPNKKKPE